MDAHEHEHHHDHEHDCDCEHDHEHEHHHHDHDHEHHHHENKRPLGSTGYTDFTVQEGASVVSATGTLPFPLDEAREKMAQIMQDLGAWVDGKDGIIGHIKCSLTSQTVATLSITLDEVQQKQTDVPGIPLTFVAIVFGIEPQDLRDEVERQLSAVVE